MRIMKCFTILIFAASLHVGARSTAQTINFSEKQVSLSKIFKEINAQTGYRFFYKDALINKAEKIDLQVQGASISEVLNICFQNLPISYSIVDKTIVLKEKSKEIKGINSSAPSPLPGKVTGMITDENNKPLSYVSVTVKGSAIGTTTGNDGKFTLEVPDGNKVLIISMLGYKTLEVPLNGMQEINISLSQSTSQLEQVVVVGYGTQIKKNLSSSISTIDVEKLNTISAPSFEGALQGQAAGVQVSQSSALGGSAVSIRIRGTSSVVGSSEPLYVIDGIPVESGSISNSNNPGAGVNNYALQTAANTNVLASINPSDIESIEILKDASAAAIYGSRGANGVVLVTTKKGKPGKTKIHASGAFGISEATHKPTFLNGPQYIMLAQEAWVNSGKDINDFWTKSKVLVDGLTQEEAMKTNTNWVNETLQTGLMEDYNISLSGGNEKTSLYTSAFLKNQSTIIRGNDYKNFGTRLNMEHRLNNILKVGAKMMVSHVDNQQVPTSWAGGVGNVAWMLPIWPVRKEDGSYFYLNENHPVAGVDLNTTSLKSNQFFGTWNINARIINGLNFRSEYGLNLLTNDDFYHKDSSINYTGKTTSATVLGNTTSWNWNNSLNYQKRLNNHNFDVLIATEAQKFKQKSNTVLGDTYFNSELQYPQDAANKSASYFETAYSFLSYIGRINYDFKGKYLLSMSLRADGSSRFAKNNKWGYFPSASVGYIPSEEKYFAPLKNIFNFFKIRASYGVVGNAGIGNYTYASTYKTLIYNGNTGITLTNLGDDNLGWEKTNQLDIGLNFEAFEGRITGELDYYNKLTTNLLLDYPVTQLSGVGSITKNVGQLTNKGYDIYLKSVNIKTKKFSWETSINFNHNENKVVKLQDGIIGGLTVSGFLFSSSLEVGLPVGLQEMVEWKGVDKETGEDTYLEISTGKTLGYNEIISGYGNFNNFFNANKKYMGNPWPKFTGGFNNNLTWNNWNLNILFTYAAGMDFSLGDMKRYLAPFGNIKYNAPVFLLDRWQNPGDDATVSQLTTQNINWTPTTEHLNRTDYLRLKDVTLGYSFKSKNNSFLNGFNCYARISNLLTFTKAPDYYWDPEFTGVNYSNTTALSVDRSAPQSKTYMFGLSYDF